MLQGEVRQAAGGFLQGRTRALGLPEVPRTCMHKLLLLQPFEYFTRNYYDNDYVNNYGEGWLLQCFRTLKSNDKGSSSPSFFKTAT